MTNKPVLKFYALDEAVTAFSTTRHGGCSRNDYGEFNINAYCGDDEDCIRRNRAALCEELGIAEDRLIMPHQTHSVEIMQIGDEFFSMPDTVRKMILEGVDGLMTNIPGVCIGVSTADCIPVLLYDAEHQACCAVHAGWRGTVKSILLKAVASMRASYGSVPSSLKACIGPGISLDNFEVGDEVYDEFAKAGFDMTKISRRYDKWHIDLWECNRCQLLSTGIPEQNIQMAGICTYSHSDEFFSARKLTVNSGRIYTGILLK